MNYLAIMNENYELKLSIEHWQDRFKIFTLNAVLKNNLSQLINRSV